MERKNAWLIPSLVGVMVLALASCGGGPALPTTSASAPPATSSSASSPIKTTTGSEAPKYGGTFTGAQAADFRTLDVFSDLRSCVVVNLTNERIWDGDWTKGPAGGYGTSETLWDGDITKPDLMTGILAESYTWKANFDDKTVTTVIKVRQGVHWGLNPDSEASRLVAGREMTADDILYNLNERLNNPKSGVYPMMSPFLRGLKGSKTGPWEITLTLPIDNWLSNIMQLVEMGPIVPKEVLAKYGDQADWRNSEGTGPFFLTDYVSGSQATLKRNPNYWGKDPIGPGKGSQLPYLDTVKWMIIPDLSTRMAAMRTAKTDYIDFLVPEDAIDMRKTGGLKEGTQQRGAVDLLFMRTDKAPFNDIRVRKAMTMAIDFQTMNNSLYQGSANIITFPYWDVKGYDDLYMDINSPDLPAEDKELFTYHPEKAQQLLADASLPNGFKATMLLTNYPAHIDYYSIIKQYWSKVGIDLTLQPMEFNSLFTIRFNRSYDQLCSCFTSPVGTYPEQAQFTGTSITNLSRIDDSKANTAAENARLACLAGDFNGAMKITRALLPYLIGQCYTIPSLRYPLYNFWWPWVKNYSGETIVGSANDYDFAKFIWIDQALRESIVH